MLTDTYTRDHMTNLVKINNQRYVVDVGFGSNGPTKPIPLEHGYNFTTIAPARGKLMYRSLIEHSDPDQRVWVYSVQEHADALWRDMYCFVEIEFFPGDFEVMNLKTMTTPQSFFVQNVMCIKTILNEEKTEPVGWVILHRDYLKRRVGDKSEIVETFKTEDDRIGALEKYFGIVLSEGAKRAIKGLASELRPKGEHA
jgi:Arylamine N-acetyltransferase